MDDGAPGPGVFEFGRAGAAGAARPDLDDAGDLGHLRGPAHCAGETLAHTLHPVAPVDVGVDLHDGEAAAFRIGPKQRDRHGIVATEQQRHRAALPDAAHRGLDAVAILRAVVEVARHVATVDDPRAAEQWSHGIEVELLRVGAVPAERAPDGAGAVRGVAGRSGLIGRAVGRAEHRDLGLQRAEIGAERHPAKCLFRFDPFGHAPWSPNLSRRHVP